MSLRAKRIAVGALVAGLLLGATGCGSGNNFRDLEGVKSQDPDLVENYNNMDGHPNLGLVCIHGAAFVTTTREYNAVTRVPDLDRVCP